MHLVEIESVEKGDARIPSEEKLTLNSIELF